MKTIENQSQNEDISPLNYKNQIIKTKFLKDKPSDPIIKAKSNPKLGDLVFFEYLNYEVEYFNEEGQKTRKIILNQVKSKSTNFIQLGKEEIIKGIEVGLMTMTLNETADFQISPSFAYGRFGLKEYSIPKDSIIYVSIKVIDYFPYKSYKNILRIKEEGVLLFKSKEYKSALEKFINATDIHDEDYDKDDKDDEVLKDDLLCSLYLNIGNCLIKLKRYYEAEYYLNNHQRLNDHNPKGYYLRCYALSCLPLSDKVKNPKIYEKMKKDYEKYVTLVDKAEDKGLIELEKILLTTEKDINSQLDGTSKQKMFNGLYSDVQTQDKSVEIPNLKEGLMTNSNNKVVFMEISYKNKEYPIEIELFYDVTPKTCENFRVLATGERTNQSGFENFTYKFTKFYRLIKGFVLQGGDIDDKQGNGGSSIYGSSFDDENFKYNHSKAGVLSMINSGKDSNKSQFFITLNKAPWLDGKHVVFGVVLRGLDHLRFISNDVRTDSNDSPLVDIVVSECGECIRKE